MQIVIDISKERFKDIQRIASVQLDSNHFKTAEQIIANGTPQPKIGRWIGHPEIETSAPEYLMFYECSECGDKQCFCKSDLHKKRFCLNCGAKMVEPQTLAYADQNTMMPAT